MPPARYALSGSRLRLSNGSTAMLFPGILGIAAVDDSETVGALRHGCHNQYTPIASALMIKPAAASSQTRRLFAAETVAMLDSGVFSIAPPFSSKAQASTSATGKPSATPVIKTGKIHSGAW